MGQDASKILMGTTQSSVKEVDNRAGSIPAGKIVRLKSDDTISIAKADGSALGISLGRDLALAGRTAIARKGLRVPILLTSGFEPDIGAQVCIDDTTGIGKASGGGVTGMNAVYASELMEGGIDEDGNACDVALIDFPGGL